MDPAALLPILSDAAHYLLPALGAWFGSRGKLDQLARELREHKAAPMPPAHPVGNGAHHEASA